MIKSNTNEEQLRYLITVAFSGMSRSNSFLISVSLFSWTKLKTPVMRTTMMSAKPVRRRKLRVLRRIRKKQQQVWLDHRRKHTRAGREQSLCLFVPDFHRKCESTFLVVTGNLNISLKHVRARNLKGLSLSPPPGKKIPLGRCFVGFEYLQFCIWGKKGKIEGKQFGMEEKENNASWAEQLSISC